MTCGPSDGWAEKARVNPFAALGGDDEDEDDDEEDMEEADRLVRAVVPQMVFGDGEGRDEDGDEEVL